jgi:hypothetical protein
MVRHGHVADLFLKTTHESGIVALLSGSGPDFFFSRHSLGPPTEIAFAADVTTVSAVRMAGRRMDEEQRSR